MTNVIYTGKTMGGVMHNQVFVKRPTEIIAELEKTNPGIGAKFISVDEYAGVQVKATAAELKGGKKNE